MPEVSLEAAEERFNPGHIQRGMCNQARGLPVTDLREALPVRVPLPQAALPPRAAVVEPAAPERLRMREVLLLKTI